MSATRGFGGRILYVPENEEGETPDNPDFTKFSDRVQSVQVSLDPQNEGWRDIGNYDVQEFTQGLPSYGVRVVYLLHVNRKDQLEDAINRLANNRVQSATLEVAVDRDSANPGYYTAKGAKPNSVTVRGEVGQPTTVEIEYMAVNMTPAAAEPAVGTGSRETDALGALSVFATSAIERGGSPVAFVTRQAEFTVSHDLTPEGTDNQVDPKAIFEGVRTVEGSVDMTIDDGGVALMNAVSDKAEADFVFKLGSAAIAPKITITASPWNDLDIDLEAGEGYIITGVAFTAKSVETDVVGE